jgi:hypothetical protein
MNQKPWRTLPCFKRGTAATRRSLPRMCQGRKLDRPSVRVLESSHELKTFDNNYSRRCARHPDCEAREPGLAVYIHAHMDRCIDADLLDALEGALALGRRDGDVVD